MRLVNNCPHKVVAFAIGCGRDLIRFRQTRFEAEIFRHSYFEWQVTIAEEYDREEDNFNLWDKLFGLSRIVPVEVPV